MNEYKKYALSKLKQSKFARFSDIKPSKVSTNSFSYHLKGLIKEGWVIKTSKGYTLAPRGLAYAAREPADKLVRMQPNVSVALLVQDSNGRVLLKKYAEQPYIGQWGLPSVAAGVADVSILEAGEWACRQIFKITPSNMRHVGDCYVRLHKGKLALVSNLSHIIRFELFNYKLTDEFMWVEPLDLTQVMLVPGTENIVARTFFNDSFFFEEFTVQLLDQEILL